MNGRVNEGGHRVRPARSPSVCDFVSIDTDRCSIDSDRRSVAGAHEGERVYLSWEWDVRVSGRYGSVSETKGLVSLTGGRVVEVSGSVR